MLLQSTKSAIYSFMPMITGAFIGSIITIICKGNVIYVTALSAFLSVIGGWLILSKTNGSEPWNTIFMSILSAGISAQSIIIISTMVLFSWYGVHLADNNEIKFYVENMVFAPWYEYFIIVLGYFAILIGYEWRKSILKAQSV